MTESTTANTSDGEHLTRRLISGGIWVVVRRVVFRFHNVYGLFGTWDGGCKKPPAAMCRKVIEAIDNCSMEVESWGDGEQTRSFICIDDCIKGVDPLMDSDYGDSLNLGRSKLVTMNQRLENVEDIAGVKVRRKYDLGAPQGVRGRNSDNGLIKQVLGWEPVIDLRTGMDATYRQIASQFAKRTDSVTVVA